MDHGNCRTGAGAVIIARVVSEYFIFELANVDNLATVAIGFAGLANISTVEDEPVMGVEHKLLGHESHQCFFDLKRVFAGCETGSVRDAENMSIDSHGWLAECIVKDDICGFAADACK